MGDSSTSTVAGPGLHLRETGVETPLPPELTRSQSVDVVAMLTEMTPDEWLDRWRREVGPDPAGHTILTVDETTRSTAATTSNGPSFGGISLTTTTAPVAPDVVADTLETALTRPAPERELFVWVESLTPLSAGESTVPLLQTLRKLGESATVTAVCHAETGSVDTAIAELFDSVEVSEPVSARIERLRAENPTNFGYLRRHWRDTKQAIEQSTRSYPQARQLHADLEETETTPQSLGVALQALVELDVIELWSDTVGSNRYNLTTYDAELLDAVGESLANAETE
ncbi:hypothetical protein AUR64_19580 [Haloprofundus marisrubri]|uniref:Uncharacterized protein n=1 Tax=Haloprofundus marisrubri TaxID=1514971 RepID=A0A0W1R5B9_9EURY|nr:hypothetical protein [Haloprofundus marisrubri]KTG08428.1 hypothetical protein AUR64_19580 [Haloprofundus marisrubri]